ncbi:MFS transporter [uncultured Cardiobacterium sp.]|uniref:NTP/NDP exchange transporter n=1 Tax=uncultured Cardiobacterium sp. TaxID=417619 RepID=UPI002602EAC3|nr:MFS transporter [uncultured Cardiobacterium sp.]
MFARLQRLTAARLGEWRALLWAFLYVLALFLAYYVLRPIRDEFGASGGTRNLPWLFTATLGAMLTLTPLYGHLVKRFPRERFIALAYRFFMLNLLVFAALLYKGGDQVLLWTGRVFFVWLSVFNLFVVSVFWSLAVDVFDGEQGKRLFGYLAAGATLGGLLGSALVSRFSHEVSPYALLLLATLLLEVAVQAARRLSRENVRTQAAAPPAENIGGSVWAGLHNTVRSPYLLGIAAFILLYSVTSTILYFQQAEIVNAHYSERAARTAFFANIDLWVNSLTLACQLLLTGQLARRLGVIAVLIILPLTGAIGFAALALTPTVAVFVAVQVARRVSNFALARPAREILYTRLSREDRYKAKNFINTVVYRSGDQIGSWGYAGLQALHLGLAQIAWLAVPLCLAWAGLSVCGWESHLPNPRARVRHENKASPQRRYLPDDVPAGRHQPATSVFMTNRKPTLWRNPALTPPGGFRR